MLSMKLNPSVAETTEGDASGVDHGQGFEPSQDLFVLANDEREQRGLDSVRLTRQPAIAVLAAVEIVGRESDEALIWEVRRKVAAGAVVAFNHILREASSTMLTDDHGAAPAGLKILRKQKDTPGENVGPNIEGEFVADPFRIVVNAVRARISGQ